MNQSRHSSAWRRWIALSGLLSLLVLSAASASHVHSAATNGTVRQECQICVTGGVSRVLPVTVPLLATLVLESFPFIAQTAQSYAACCLRPANPRSPPVML